MEEKNITAPANNQSAQASEDARATSLVSMTKKDKEYLSLQSRKHMDFLCRHFSDWLQKSTSRIMNGKVGFYG